MKSNSIVIDASKYELLLNISSNKNWSYKTTETKEWCKVNVDTASNQITISVEENDSDLSRDFSFRIINECGEKQDFILHQKTKEIEKEVIEEEEIPPMEDEEDAEEPEEEVDDMIDDIFDTSVTVSDIVVEYHNYNITTSSMSYFYYDNFSKKAHGFSRGMNCVIFFNIFLQKVQLFAF